MKKLFLLSTTILFLFTSSLFAQKKKEDAPYHKFFVGSSAFMLLNLNTKDNNPPNFYQINFGYRITPKDVVSVEAKTWTYGWPIGIPLGNAAFEKEGEGFPGYVKSHGIAIAYQRYLWKGLYTAVHAMNSSQTFYDKEDVKIQNGYQLFMTYRLGYHIELFNNRFFIEPGIALTHRPIETNQPEGFKVVNDKWPKTFFPEPGLHFGVKF
ncbi:MAG: hypothetical protein NWQ46_10980 [Spirosomaceae bacterium]|nr:hypothetical protein [Spirosomataceae bacterium]MDP5140224.1 hypothetical protein [Spirosomataceae bacterium]